MSRVGYVASAERCRRAACHGQCRPQTLFSRRKTCLTSGSSFDRVVKNDEIVPLRACLWKPNPSKGALNTPLPASEEVGCHRDSPSTFWAKLDYRITAASVMCRPPLCAGHVDIGGVRPVSRSIPERPSRFNTVSPHYNPMPVHNRILGAATCARKLDSSVCVLFVGRWAASAAAAARPRSRGCRRPAGQTPDLIPAVMREEVRRLPGERPVDSDQAVGADDGGDGTSRQERSGLLRKGPWRLQL